MKGFVRFLKFKPEAIFRLEVSETTGPAPSLILIVPFDKSKIVGLFAGMVVLIESDTALVPVVGEFMAVAFRTA